jgi:hypothetical protein
MKSAITLLILSAITYLPACVEQIELPLESADTRMLVVEGQFTSDTTIQTIRLSLTSDFYETNTDPVENATVSVTDGTNTYLFMEDPKIRGLYKTPAETYGMPGKKYKLMISGTDTNGDGETESYTAESQMPAMSGIDSINVSIENLFSTDMLRVSYYGQEDPAPNDAYLFRLRINTWLVTNNLNECTISEDQTYNGQYMIDEPAIYFIQKDRYVRNGVELITLESCHIPYDYYLFLNDVRWESLGSDPFSGNPANIRTNITGTHKALGFFAAYSITRKSKIFKP